MYLIVKEIDLGELSRDYSKYWKNIMINFRGKMQKIFQWNYSKILFRW